MGEALGEVFATQDGEAMKEWTARVRETFEKCQRKAKVDFPVEARGWIALHCAGLSEEQKAIVKAKTQGKLDLETVSAGIRSCFPTYRAGGSKSRRATSVFIAEENDNTPEDDETNDFPDVEAFLSDFGQTVNEEDPLSEGDVAEALAVSWKERRAEIGKLQKSRKFGAADQARRSFRIEVEELKRRPRCRRCGKLEKECRSKPARALERALAKEPVQTAPVCRTTVRRRRCWPSPRTSRRRSTSWELPRSASQWPSTVCEHSREGPACLDARHCKSCA